MLATGDGALTALGAPASGICMNSDIATAFSSRQALAAENRSLPNRVTGRLRLAITEMVWSGARRADAAKAAGMTDHSLRAALRKPHVIGYYRAELRTLRESERSRTFHRLCDLRDQDSNKNAAVAAARSLEQITDVEVSRPTGTQTQPGLCIVIAGAPAPKIDAPTIDVTPSAETDHQSAIDD
jgi:hypothetical protein